MDGIFVCKIYVSVVSNHCVTEFSSWEAAENRRKSAEAEDLSSVFLFYSVFYSLKHLFLHSTNVIHVPGPHAGLTRERERERRKSHSPCTLQELAVHERDHRRR